MDYFVAIGTVMPRDKARRNQVFAELAKQGVPAVETRLSQRIYGKHNEALVREWLAGQAPKPVTPRAPRGLLGAMRRQPVGILRKQPGRVIVWLAIGIVLLEVLGVLASAIVSSPSR